MVTTNVTETDSEGGGGPGGPDLPFIPNMYETTVYPEIKL